MTAEPGGAPHLSRGPRADSREDRSAGADRLGPGGLRSVAVFGVLGVLKALALVLIAEALARGIVAALDQDGAALSGAVALGLAGAVLRAALIWAHRWFATRAAVTAKQSIRHGIAAAVLRNGAAAPPDGPPAVAGSRAGTISAVAAIGLDELDEYYRSVLPTMISAVAVPVVVGLRILSVDWVSALIIVLTIPLVPIFMILVGQHSQAQADSASRKLQRLSDHLVELGRGLPVLVGLGRLDDQAAALDRIGVAHKDATMRTLRTAFLSSLVLELIATISVAVVAVFIGVRLIDGSLPLSVGLLALVLAPECFQPFRELGAAFHSSQDGLAALRRSRELTAGAEPGDDATGDATGPVRLEHLSAGYGRSPVLDDVTAHFPAGAITAVTGASGSGKSTLLAVLAGLLPPSEGTVQGVDPDRLAWVPQHPHTVGRTVRAELELYAPGPRAVPPVLAELGLEAVADDDPARISPGELRRVAVGRGLLRVAAGADLLLLDEPTAHLDDASARAVLEALAGVAGNPQVTVVVASHDDRVLRMAGFRVRVGRQGGTRLAPDAGHSAPGPEAVSGPAAPEPGTDTTPNRAAGAEGPTRPAVTPSGTVQAEFRAFLRPSAWRWVGAILLGTAAALFAASLTALSGWLIVRAAQQPPIMYLMVAIVGVRFFGIGRAALRYAERLVTHSAVFTSLVDLRSRIWAGLAQRGLSTRALATGPSAMEYLVVAADRVRDLTPRVLLPAAVAVTTAAASWIAYGLLVPRALWVIVAAAVISVVIAPAVAALADRAAAQAVLESKARMTREFVAIVTAAPEIRANGIGERVLSRVTALDETAARDAKRGSWALGLGEALVALATVSAAVLVLGPAAGALAAGDIADPMVAVVALLPLGLTEPFSGAVAAAQQAPALRGALARTARVTAPPGVSRPRAEEPGRAAQEPAGQKPAGGRSPVLRIEDLATRWPGANDDAFGPLTATVRPGRWLVVEGPSGSGKSTLLATIMGHVAPSTGSVVVDRGTADESEGDGAAVVDLGGHPAAAQGLVVWCPQEAHLFASTIRGNLALARSPEEAPTDAQMTQVLLAVGLGPFLDNLPQGLDTWVGSGGSELSGGQAQRLAVARALLAPGKVVLLDEPTAHLDADGARELMDDLRSALAERIVVLVTHHTEDVSEEDQRVNFQRRRTAPGSPAPAPAEISG